MLNTKLSEFSQVEVLKERMAEAGFTHGKEARVSLHGVQFRRTGEKEGVIYFCDIEKLEIHNVLAEGDGGPLPDDAKLENIQLSTEGSHDLFDVILASNGSLQLKADAQSRATCLTGFPWARWFRRFIGQKSLVAHTE